MSNALFPNLPLICAGMEITPLWNTQKSNTSSGRQFTLGKRVDPNYNIKIPFNVLRGHTALFEYETLRGFFSARKGGLDDFLFKIPFENTALNYSFGAGDGVTTTFKLTKSLGGFSDFVGGVDTATAVINVSGVVTSVTFSADLSKVIFATAPAAGAALTWSGTFYIRCRFVNDKLPFKAIARGLYSTSCEIEGFQP
jgi:uncharacterized protein (TIGR02217 family)